MSHKEQIRSLGMKVTGPRLKILSLFEENPERHLSAEDVYRITLEHDMNIGVATVYRVLAQLKKQAFWCVINSTKIKRYMN